MTAATTTIRQAGWRDIGVAAGVALLIAFPFLAQLSGNSFLISIGSRVLIYALAASSLNLALGYGGMVSLGHAAFLGLGAYTAAILTFHYYDDSLLFGFIPGTNNALIVAVAAVGVSALFAGATGALALRTSGVQFLMITLAFGQMVYYLFVALKTYGGDDGLRLRRANELFGISLRDDFTLYYLCLAILLAYFIAIRRFINSRFGFVIRGSRENERRIEHFGYATYRYKLVCYVIAGSVAGLAGALIANHGRFVSPDLMHWTKSSELLVMLVLGGVATRYGALIGAVILIALESLLSSVTDHWMFVLGPVLVAIVLLNRPGFARRE